MDPSAPELTPGSAPPQRQQLDPVDQRLTSALLALLLGFVVGLVTWSVIWPLYQDAAAPSPEALQNRDWPTPGVILWSLLVLALWTALWVVFFYWALARRR